MRKLGTQIEALVPTQSPSTGDAKDADALPAGTVYKNNVADALAVTVSNVTTGLYAVYFTPTVGAGFASGDRVTCVLSATVSGITGHCEVANDVLQAGLPADVYSDTTILVSDSIVVEGSVGVLSVQAATIASDVVLVAADVTSTVAVVDNILSDTTIIASDSAVVETAVGGLSVTTATIASDLVLVYSDTAGIPAAVWALTNDDSETYAASLRRIRAFASGKATLSGSSALYYGSDDLTLLFTAAMTTTARTIT